MKIVAKKRIPSGIPKSYSQQKDPKFSVSDIDNTNNNLNNFIRNDPDDEVPLF